LRYVIKNNKNLLIFLFVFILTIPVFIFSKDNDYYDNKKHSFSLAVTNDWKILSDRHMKLFYKNEEFLKTEKASDFEIIFTALKYNEKYALKNNMPNPTVIILYSNNILNPKELVDSLSYEMVSNKNFKYDGGNEISPIGSLDWHSRYVSAQINSLMVLQDYYATVHNDKTYLIIATSFSNENLYEVYDLLESIVFYK